MLLLFLFSAFSAILWIGYYYFLDLVWHGFGFRYFQETLDHCFFAGSGFGGFFYGYLFSVNYQKARIMNFIHPLQDIRGTGYNAYQSIVATVGSGQVLGKGVGIWYYSLD